jgi:hypothetical protein
MCTGVNQAFLACVEAVMPFPILAWEITADEKLHSLIGEEVLRFYDCHKQKKRYYVNKDHAQYIMESVCLNSTLILI